LRVTEGIGITNQKDLIKNIIQECDCPFFIFCLANRPEQYQSYRRSGLAVGATSTRFAFC
jgi:hypothetical protein